MSNIPFGKAVMLKIYILEAKYLQVSLSPLHALPNQQQALTDALHRSGTFTDFTTSVTSAGGNAA